MGVILKTIGIVIMVVGITFGFIIYLDSIGKEVDEYLLIYRLESVVGSIIILFSFITFIIFYFLGELSKGIVKLNKKFEE